MKKTQLLKEKVKDAGGSLWVLIFLNLSVAMLHFFLEEILSPSDYLKCLFPSFLLMKILPCELISVAHSYLALAS